MSNEKDLITNDVIDWFRYMKISFIRINKTSQISISDFLIKKSKIDFTLKISNPNVEPVYTKSSEIKGFWHRRGAIDLVTHIFENHELLNQDLNSIYNGINFYLSFEKDVIKSAMLTHFLRRRSIGNFHNSETNKLDNLIIANEVGLDIPNTIISSNRKSLEEFMEENPKLITKPMYHTSQNFGGYYFGAGTHSITKKNIKDFNLNGFPSFFQEELDKAYELRIFYLKGDTYTTAIFSQNDEKTKIDFRNYNRDLPNRRPPYKLPDKVKYKLIEFMKKIDQDSGSIDIVVTKEKRYVFLEVNPIGQFFQVSYPGNFFIERKIANYFNER